MIVLFEAVSVRALASTADGLTLLVVDLVNRIGIRAVPVQTVLIPSKLLCLDGYEQDRLFVPLFRNADRVIGRCFRRGDEDGGHHKAWCCWFSQVDCVDGQDGLRLDRCRRLTRHHSRSCCRHLGSGGEGQE